jgi:sporulation protein YlmC with PRC-barrel domain
MNGGRLGPPEEGTNHMSLEDLRAGARVISRDGDNLGTLNRVVIVKETLKLTHLVVAAEGRVADERVVPLGVLRDASEDAVHLSMSTDEFREFAVKYDTLVYRPMPDSDRGRLDASDLRRFAASLPGEMGPAVMTDVLTKAPDEVDIAKDSAVWRLNPHQKIGEVEHVIFDDETRRIVSLVIRRGFLFTTDVVLPVQYVTEVVEALGGIVRVEIDDASLKQLQEFHPGR